MGPICKCWLGFYLFPGNSLHFCGIISTLRSKWNLGVFSISKTRPSLTYQSRVPCHPDPPLPIFFYSPSLLISQEHPRHSFIGGVITIKCRLPPAVTRLTPFTNFIFTLLNLTPLLLHLLVHHQCTQALRGKDLHPHKSNQSIVNTMLIFMCSDGV